jgi:hypothetical protein
VGGAIAAQWIKKTFEEEAGLKCGLEDFKYGYNPNVICYWERNRRGGEEEEGREDAEAMVVLGAHYDSRGSFGMIRVGTVIL